MHDANIQDDALYRLGTRAKQAASALVLMVDPAGEEAIAAALTAAGAAATTVGLDEATATRLAEAAGAAAASAAEPAGAEAAPDSEPASAGAPPPSAPTGAE